MVITKGTQVKNVKTGQVGVLKADLRVENPDKFFGVDGTELTVVAKVSARSIQQDQKSVADDLVQLASDFRSSSQWIVGLDNLESMLDRWEVRKAKGISASEYRDDAKMWFDLFRDFNSASANIKANLASAKRATSVLSSIESSIQEISKRFQNLS